MILEQINKKPFIHFGFNQTEKTIPLGEKVIFWQDIIYGSDAEIISNNGVVINKNRAYFTPTTVGVYDITITMANKKKLIEVDSNTITLTVV